MLMAVVDGSERGETASELPRGLGSAIVDDRPQKSAILLRSPRCRRKKRGCCTAFADYFPTRPANAATCGPSASTTSATPLALGCSPSSWM